MIRRVTLARGRSRRLALGGIAVLALVVALVPGEAAPVPVRAAAAACAIGAAALLARGGLGPRDAARRLTVISRQALSRDTGVALLEIDGRAVVIGFGGGAVHLLDVPPPPAPPSPPPGPRVEAAP